MYMHTFFKTQPTYHSMVWLVVHGNVSPAPFYDYVHHHGGRIYGELVVRYSMSSFTTMVLCGDLCTVVSRLLVPIAICSLHSITRHVINERHSSS